MYHGCIDKMALKGSMLHHIPNKGILSQPEVDLAPKPSKTCNSLLSSAVHDCPMLDPCLSWPQSWRNSKSPCSTLAAVVKAAWHQQGTLELVLESTRISKHHQPNYCVHHFHPWFLQDIRSPANDVPQLYNVISVLPGLCDRRRRDRKTVPKNIWNIEWNCKPWNVACCFHMFPSRSCVMKWITPGLNLFSS